LISRPLPDPPTDEGAISISGASPFEISSTLSRSPPIGRLRRHALLPSLRCPLCRVIRGPSWRRDSISRQIDGAMSRPSQASTGTCPGDATALGSITITGFQKVGPHQKPFEMTGDVDIRGSLEMGIRHFSAPIDNSIQGPNVDTRDPSHAPSNSHGQGPCVPHSSRSPDLLAIKTGQYFPILIAPPFDFRRTLFHKRSARRKDPPLSNLRKGRKLPLVRRSRPSSQIKLTFPRLPAAFQPVLTDT
jgi:hypothetical protein